MPVLHQPDHHRFVLATPAGEAELTYRIRPDGAWDLRHTFVPEAARGATIASDLVTAVVALARGQGIKLVATCPYVESWLKRHPAEQELFVA